MTTIKQQAEQHREIEATFLAAAEACAPLHPVTAKKLRAEAKLHRKMADDLDPPQPAWHSGDLARERRGDLWQFDGEWWHLGGKKLSTAGLNRYYGPIHKVYIADPQRREVVVSLEGLDRDFIDKGWGDLREDDIYLSTSGSLASRVAKAAREQLGEVQ